ncbi:MAG: glycoside hydrolase, end-alpha-1,4-polygalactosaminidase [Deltaproteobacteria bacterium]|nr:MAG: glycoside hydrolase, end-alpha-1,4-polygalactosaminidase [Deltaproteobacteria bacterium]
MTPSKIVRLASVVLFLAISASRQADCGEPATVEDRHLLLQKAQTWMYQLQDLESDRAIQALANTKYPLLVVEPGHNQKEISFDSQRMLQVLHTMPDGRRRLVLAYIDIGQAEDWRTYWEEDWIAPTSQKRGFPDFLITVDPDGWQGCYLVAYWDRRWKDIWVGPDGIVATLAEMGFDGVYLDWVEAYDDEQVRKSAERAKINPEQEMIRFIEEIGAVGKKIIPDFLVVVQNAPFLIDEAPERYLRAIDALAVEDTWFHGEGDVDWDDPGAGDLRNRHDDDWTTENRLLQYNKYLQHGLPVFSVDYCIEKNNVEKVYREARKAGLRPLVTKVSLSRITATPPESF